MKCPTRTISNQWSQSAFAGQGREFDRLVVEQRVARKHGGTGRRAVAREREPGVGALEGERSGPGLLIALPSEAPGIALPDALAQDDRRDETGVRTGDQGGDDRDAVESLVLLPEPELPDVGVLAPAGDLQERAQENQLAVRRGRVDRWRHLGKAGRRPLPLERQMVRIGLGDEYLDRQPDRRLERDLPASFSHIASRPQAGLVRTVKTFGLAAGEERPGLAFRVDDQAREIAALPSLPVTGRKACRPGVEGPEGGAVAIQVAELRLEQQGISGVEDLGQARALAAGLDPGIGQTAAAQQEHGAQGRRRLAPTPCGQQQRRNAVERAKRDRDQRDVEPDRARRSGEHADLVKRRGEPGQGDEAEPRPGPTRQAQRRPKQQRPNPKQRIVEEICHDLS